MDAANTVVSEALPSRTSGHGCVDERTTCGSTVNHVGRVKDIKLYGAWIQLHPSDVLVLTHYPDVEALLPLMEAGDMIQCSDVHTFPHFVENESEGIGLAACANSKIEILRASSKNRRDYKNVLNFQILHPHWIRFPLSSSCRLLETMNILREKFQFFTDSPQHNIDLLNISKCIILSKFPNFPLQNLEQDSCQFHEPMHFFSYPMIQLREFRSLISKHFCTFLEHYVQSKKYAFDSFSSFRHCEISGEYFNVILVAQLQVNEETKRLELVDCFDKFSIVLSDPEYLNSMHIGNLYHIEKFDVIFSKKHGSQIIQKWEDNKESHNKEVVVFLPPWGNLYNNTVHPDQFEFFIKFSIKEVKMLYRKRRMHDFSEFLNRHIALCGKNRKNLHGHFISQIHKGKRRSKQLFLIILLKKRELVKEKATHYFEADAFVFPFNFRIGIFDPQSKSIHTWSKKYIEEIDKEQNLQRNGKYIGNNQNENHFQSKLTTSYHTDHHSEKCNSNQVPDAVDRDQEGNHLKRTQLQDNVPHHIKNSHLKPSVNCVVCQTSNGMLNRLQSIDLKWRPYIGRNLSNELNVKLKSKSHTQSSKKYQIHGFCHVGSDVVLHDTYNSEERMEHERKKRKVVMNLEKKMGKSSDEFNGNIFTIRFSEKVAYYHSVLQEGKFYVFSPDYFHSPFFFPNSLIGKLTSQPQTNPDSVKHTQSINHVYEMTSNSWIWEVFIKESEEMPQLYTDLCGKCTVGPNNIDSGLNLNHDQNSNCFVREIKSKFGTQKREKNVNHIRALKECNNKDSNQDRRHHLDQKLKFGSHCDSHLTTKEKCVNILNNPTTPCKESDECACGQCNYCSSMMVITFPSHFISKMFRSHVISEVIGCVQSKKYSQDCFIPNVIKAFKSSSNFVCDFELFEKETVVHDLQNKILIENENEKENCQVMGKKIVKEHKKNSESLVNVVKETQCINAKRLNGIKIALHDLLNNKIFYFTSKTPLKLFCRVVAILHIQIEWKIEDDPTFPASIPKIKTIDNSSMRKNLSTQYCQICKRKGHESKSIYVRYASVIIDDGSARAICTFRNDVANKLFDLPIDICLSDVHTEVLYDRDSMAPEMKFSIWDPFILKNVIRILASESRLSIECNQNFSWVMKGKCKWYEHMDIRRLKCGDLMENDALYIRHFVHGLTMKKSKVVYCYSNHPINPAFKAYHVENVDTLLECHSRLNALKNKILDQ